MLCSEIKPIDFIDWNMNQEQRLSLEEMIFGELVAKGAYRKVYNHKQDKSMVIKLEDSNGRRFCNVIEWEFWQYAKNTILVDWLAPCIDISKCGTILFMKKVEPVGVQDLPKKIPSCFTDLKMQNWGKLDDKIVCCDYGNLIFNINTTLKEARWWKKS